jgi:S-adenosylmethionine-diacylgycerolhomoserine-N-methlytransferase
MDATHADRMDRKYRIVRHTYDLTRRWFLFGRDRALDLADPSSTGSLLEVGCGTGRNLAILARRHPGARLFGVDISAQMLASSARRLAGMPVTLAVADAQELAPGTVAGEPSFDVVLFSYSLSMVPDWRAALAGAMSCVAPGGRLVVVDFGRFEGWGTAGRWMVKALGRAQAPPLLTLEDEVLAIAAHSGMQAIRNDSLYGGWCQLVEAVRPSGHA